MAKITYVVLHSHAHWLCVRRSRCRRRRRLVRLVSMYKVQTNCAYDDDDEDDDDSSSGSIAICSCRAHVQPKVNNKCLSICNCAHWEKWLLYNTFVFIVGICVRVYDCHENPFIVLINFQFFYRPKDFLPFFVNIQIQLWNANGD